MEENFFTTIFGESIDGTDHGNTTVSFCHWKFKIQISNVSMKKMSGKSNSSLTGYCIRHRIRHSIDMYMLMWNNRYRINKYSK